jgi:phenolic acid decarboxylase
VNKDLKQWYHLVKQGDLLSPLPDWNKDKPFEKWLPPKVHIYDINDDAPSGTGVAFKVMLMDKSVHWLDPKWFVPPHEDTE